MGRARLQVFWSIHKIPSPGSGTACYGTPAETRAFALLSQRVRLSTAAHPFAFCTTAARTPNAFAPKIAGHHGHGPRGFEWLDTRYSSEHPAHHLQGALGKAAPWHRLEG